MSPPCSSLSTKINWTLTRTRRIFLLSFVLIQLLFLLSMLYCVFSSSLINPALTTSGIILNTIKIFLRAAMKTSQRPQEASDLSRQKKSLTLFLTLKHMAWECRWLQHELLLTAWIIPLSGLLSACTLLLTAQAVISKVRLPHLSISTCHSLWHSEAYASESTHLLFKMNRRIWHLKSSLLFSKSNNNRQPYLLLYD